MATLGSELRVRDHDAVPLPWRLVRDAPLFDNVIPGRFAVYAALAACLIAALWAAAPDWPRALRIVLTALAAAALVPAVGHGYWHEHPERPAFFTHGLDRLCLRRNENVLLLPPPFRNEAPPLAGRERLPLPARRRGAQRRRAEGASRPCRDAPGDRRRTCPRGGARALLALARAQDVSTILVDAAGGEQWRRVLDPVLRGRTLGGMTLYRLDRERPVCRQD